MTDSKRERQHSVVCGVHSIRYPAAYGQCPHCPTEAGAEAAGAVELIEPVTVVQSAVAGHAQVFTGP